MEQKYYTNERNVQIVISLLKAHGIKKVIASPGTTNLTFVASLMYDGSFEIYSSVDERSAAYMACGMASESGEPVVLSCTGATASRNYLPGLTEAYYRKLPILAITSHQGHHRIGHLIPQNIDRRVLSQDIVFKSVTLPLVKDRTDERYCEIEANKAILELYRRGGGPSHINLYTSYSRDYSVKELPSVNVIKRFYSDDSLPPIKEDGRIAVYIGSHSEFTEKETAAIDDFCATYDAVVFCDHTSGYHGKYSVHQGLLLQQSGCNPVIKNIGLLIHIGEVSGDYCGMCFCSQRTWRVNDDGELRDTFGNLACVFQMREVDFFEEYSKKGENKTNFLNLCLSEYDKICKNIPELPFGNIWIAQHVAPMLPAESQIHLGILNSLRSWNYFLLPQGVESRSNVGGFGIDGNLSSLIGASLVHKDKLYFGFMGDLAFFYDLNSLGNRHVGKNLRIMLINNGKGTEFRNYDHPGSQFGEDADAFIAAAGHYGNKSKDLVKLYAKSLGFKYLSASNKSEFTENISSFVSAEIGEQSILFECFTDNVNESEALKMIRSIIEPPYVPPTKKEILKKAVKSVVGEKVVNGIKKICGN